MNALQYELDQRHQYARHAFDRFLQYCALAWTLNAVAAGWLAVRREPQLDIIADCAFILINAHASYITTRMLGQVRTNGLRIAEITRCLQEPITQNANIAISAMNDDWQMFLIRQFRIAFNVLVFFWLVSIAEAFGLFGQHLTQP